jgi:preprotein translocase subunit SecG
MYTFLIVLHVLVSVLLIVVILMQSSKGGGLSGTFGGAASTAVFGGRGAGSFLSKVTVSLAFTFMALAIVIGLLGDVSEKSGSVVMQKAQESGQWSQPAGDQIETEPPTGN